MNHTILPLISGLSLFIYGMFIMSDSLKRVTLSRVRVFLESMTANKWYGVVAGTGITAVIQSSSAMSVILIGFINAGMLSFMAALPVMLGASIGTTITSQIIAFRLNSFAPAILPIGLGLMMFGRKNMIRHIGRAIIGFGILFLGLGIMDSAVAPLAASPDIKDWFLQFSQSPLLAIFFGFVITAILQSSSTTVGIVIALAFSGLIDFNGAFFLILGDNIGTCVTGLIASIGGTSAARRLAFANIAFKTVGVLIAYLMFPLYSYAVPLMGGDIGRQVANIHTVFNVVSVLLLLPFTTFFGSIISKIVRGEDYRKRQLTSLDRNLLTTPPQALEAVRREIADNVEIAADILSGARKSLHRFNRPEFEKVLVYEEESDKLRQQMVNYLIELSARELDEKTAGQVPAYLQGAITSERLGDIAKKIAGICENKHEYDIVLSKAAYGELEKLFEDAQGILMDLNKFLKSDMVRGRRTLQKRCQNLAALTSSLRLGNLSRLRRREESEKAGLIFIDYLNNFDRIVEYARTLLVLFR